MISHASEKQGVTPRSRCFHRAMTASKALLQDLEADCFASSEQRVLAAFVVRPAPVQAAAAAPLGRWCFG